MLDSTPPDRPPLPADPGPDHVPDRILRAIEPADDRPPRAGVRRARQEGARRHPEVFKTRHPVVIYPASGTGAWEAALVNTLVARRRVLMFETGHFAALWNKMADRGLA